MPPTVSSYVLGHELQLISQILDDDDESDSRPEYEWIGRYRLLNLLGEGGFGQVWLAEQSEPVRREVALKLLKRGMDSDQILARFNLERQALASMTHPNIAALLDAGSSDEGRPFFVMDYVKGLSVTHWCQEKQVSVVEKVALFLQICSGLQHAHQKGIIHRDLKPSNMIVAEPNGVAVPKIIDFGIAKATSELFQDQPWVTRVGNVMGTPLYMSPEQLAGGADVDTRSDIYSLGVVFYEMLTGIAPHGARTHAAMSYDEVRRVVEENRPVRPSLKLTEIELQGGLSAAHKADSRLIIPADLDWIILKALEKDRDRRYHSAADLAADLQRFLDKEPVQARPPSAYYLASLWIRRNRAIFAAALVCVVSLLVGTGLALWQAHEAYNAQVKAEAEAKRTQQAVQFLTSLLDRVAEEVANGRNPEALKLALSGSEEKIRQIQDDPLLQSDLFSRVGWLYKSMGERGLSLPLIKAHAEANAVIYGTDSHKAWKAEINYLSYMMEHGARIQVPDLAADLIRRIELKGEQGGEQWFLIHRVVIQVLGKFRQRTEASKAAHKVIDDLRLEKLSAVLQLLIKGACAVAFQEAKEYDLADKIVLQCATLCQENPSLMERLPWVEEIQLNIQRSKGDRNKGAELAKAQLVRIKATRGDKDPSLIKVMLILAEFESGLKHHEAAIAVARDSVQLASDLLASSAESKETSKIAALRENRMLAQFCVVNCEYKAGHSEQALQMAHEANRVAIAEGNKSNVAETMLLLAQMQEKTGDLEAAYATYELRGHRSADGGANYQRWHEDLQARCSIRLKQGRHVEAMHLAKELWTKEKQSPDALKDTGHLTDIAKLAMQCHKALTKEFPQTVTPPEFAEWEKLVGGSK